MESFPLHLTARGFRREFHNFLTSAHPIEKVRNPNGVRALTAGHSKGPTFQERSIPKNESQRVRHVPPGLGGRCCGWIFVRACYFEGKNPEEQKLRGRAPDVCAASPRHRGGNRRGRWELGLSEITFTPAPARIVGGARHITRPVKKREGLVKSEGSTREDGDPRSKMKFV